jgi:hypothetical protein
MGALALVIWAAWAWSDSLSRAARFTALQIGWGCLPAFCNDSATASSSQPVRRHGSASTVEQAKAAAELQDRHERRRRGQVVLERLRGGWRSIRCHRQVVVADGVSPSVITAASDLRAEKYISILFSDPAAFLDNARADAVKILTARRHQVEAVAAALIEHKTLDGAEIDDVFSVTPALRAERTRRGRWAAAVENASAFGMVMEPLRM